MNSDNSPNILAIFQKRIDGDDALLSLASERFKDAGLGMEVYAGSITELAWILSFRPSRYTPLIVHLPRQFDIMERSWHSLIYEMITHFSQELYGFVIHDQDAAVACPGDYLKALQSLNTGLCRLVNPPFLFVEYAIGLAPDHYLELLESISGLERISGCLDIGHLGIRQIRTTFQDLHPQKNICNLRPCDEELPSLIEDMIETMEQAVIEVAAIAGRAAEIGKPLHYHLHDGHPLSSASPFGVSDHLSFLTTIPIPFTYQGKKQIPSLFGLRGLNKIIRQSFASLAPVLHSFTLEIHPPKGRIPLEKRGSIFQHWQDKTNAEQQNFWLSTLIDNQTLLHQVMIGV